MPRKRTQSAETQNSSNKNSLNESDPQRSDLKSLTLERAIEMYLADRSRGLRQSSLQTHRTALNFFERRLNTQEIENLNEFSGRHFHHYRIWRREDAPAKTDDLRTHYDARDEHSKMEVRHRGLDHARRDHSIYGGR